MTGYFLSVPITHNKQNFAQGFSEIESQWETPPANGGKFRWKIELPRKAGDAG